MQQALDDLIEIAGVTKADVAAAQAAKLAKAGAFKGGVFVEYVEVDENDPWTTYYRDNPDRYPEIK